MDKYSYVKYSPPGPPPPMGPRFRPRPSQLRHTCTQIRIMQLHVWGQTQDNFNPLLCCGLTILKLTICYAPGHHNSARPTTDKDRIYSEVGITTLPDLLQTRIYSELGITNLPDLQYYRQGYIQRWASQLCQTYYRQGYIQSWASQLC